MTYNDYIYFLMFLPASLIVYQLLNQKIRYISLLMFSLAFVSLFGISSIFFPFVIAAIIYITALMLERQKTHCESVLKQTDREQKKAIKSRFTKKKRIILASGVLLTLSMLVILKYFDFFAEAINHIRGAANTGEKISMLHIIAPIGISFYTLQAIGYMADVYWGKTPAEKNYFKLLLFLCFFPTVMEGPICSYTDIKGSLFRGESLKSDNLAYGSIRIVWGLFKKIVVADRLYVIVAALFDRVESYSGAYIVIAAISYTIQLYMEFSGCMDIVIGSGRLFGITLPENFRQPFLSKNASEFWRRWHITLGVWLKTYIFYPVSMSGAAKKWNQFGKEKLSRHFTMLVVSALALFPVWVCNGLWHGAGWNYIFYGMYYFVVIMLELILEPVGKGITNTLKIAENNKLISFLRIFKTWIIIFIGELFFRANSLKQGFSMFFAMFKDFHFSTFTNGSIYALGLSKADFLAAVVGAIIVFAVGIIRERHGNILEIIGEKKLYIRWTIYIALILAVIIFGAYGAGYTEVDFIYADF